MRPAKLIKTIVPALNDRVRMIRIWGEGDVQRLPIIGWVLYSSGEEDSVSDWVQATPITPDGGIEGYSCATILEYWEDGKAYLWSCPDCADFDSFEDAKEHGLEHRREHEERRAQLKAKAAAKEANDGRRV